VPSDAVLTSLITASGGLLTVYIVQKLRNTKPKRDRIDGAFEMYELYIKKLEEDNDRLRKENAAKDIEINRLRRGEA
jgi:hypothetical protein